ncbi:ORF6N domain-containing protein [Sphingobacterium alkalisoli]|uniref:ORF6N domain-containing protein n=1 Tax=Sphingobacterium alkalisoli TaxID=1874115 RepID=A0A4U0H2V1_9SPHI|nr:ORF6N domain-containing protein [Sphingobacterium alkalisoli]TJY65828.1 ORF6N domain-containing protein [Sphingobacterium alkalisoli]
MSKKVLTQITPPEDDILASKIYIIRKRKVMLDRDLASIIPMVVRNCDAVSQFCLGSISYGRGITKF